MNRIEVNNEITLSQILNKDIEQIPFYPNSYLLRDTYGYELKLRVAQNLSTRYSDIILDGNDVGGDERWQDSHYLFFYIKKLDIAFVVYSSEMKSYLELFGRMKIQTDGRKTFFIDYFDFIKDYNRKILIIADVSNRRSVIRHYGLSSIFPHELEMKNIIDYSCEVRQALKIIMEKNDFDSLVSIGKVGEQVCHEYYERYRNSTVTDVRQDKGFQIVDVDYVVTKNDRDNLSELVEVKTGTKDSPNLFFQTYSNVETMKLGYLYKTRCNQLFYYDWPNQTVYIFDFMKLKEFLHTYPLQSIQSKSGKITRQGILLPKSVIESEPYDCGLIESFSIIKNGGHD